MTRTDSVSAVPLLVRASALTLILPVAVLNSQADQPSRHVPPPVIAVNRVALQAWRDILSSDAAILAALNSGATDDLEWSAGEFINAAETVSANVSVADAGIQKRMDSAVTQMIQTAERLKSAAAVKKLDRCKTIYTNLHRYVAWVQANAAGTLLEGDSR